MTNKGKEVEKGNQEAVIEKKTEATGKKDRNPYAWLFEGICYRCGLTGHPSNACPQRKTVAFIDEEDEDSFENLEESEEAKMIELDDGDWISSENRALTKLLTLLPVPTAVFFLRCLPWLVIVHSSKILIIFVFFFFFFFPFWNFKGSPLLDVCCLTTSTTHKAPTCDWRHKEFSSLPLVAVNVGPNGCSDQINVYQMREFY